MRTTVKRGSLNIINEMSDDYVSSADNSTQLIGRESAVGSPGDDHFIYAMPRIAIQNVLNVFTFIIIMQTLFRSERREKNAMICCV